MKTSSAFKSEYETAVKRIQDAGTRMELNSIDESLTRCYENGVFTSDQYYTLCVRIMEQELRV